MAKKAKPELWVMRSVVDGAYETYLAKPPLGAVSGAGPYLDFVPTRDFVRLTGIRLRKGQMQRVSVKAIGKVYSAKTGRAAK